MNPTPLILLHDSLYVIDRSRVGTEDCPEEIVDLAGSTGNIYTIHIKKQPTCTCMAYQHTISPKTGLGDECKHILYVRLFLSCDLACAYLVFIRSLTASLRRLRISSINWRYFLLNFAKSLRMPHPSLLARHPALPLAPQAIVSLLRTTALSAAALSRRTATR